MKTIFIKAVAEKDKASFLLESVKDLRSGQVKNGTYFTNPKEFECIPGSPFSYWLGSEGLDAFKRLPYPSDLGAVARQGLGTADDFRFVRCWWEVNNKNIWQPYAKGGKSTPHYCDLHLVVNWNASGDEIKSNTDSSGKIKSNIWMLEGTARDYFFREGLTWASRPHGRGTFCIVPAGAIFSVSGMMLFCESREDLLSLSALLNSSPYINLLHSIMPRGGEGSGQTLKYEIIYLFSVPIPRADSENRKLLERLVQKAWREARHLDAANETSHAFFSPSILHKKIGLPEHYEIKKSLDSVQSEIDDIAFRLYGLESNLPEEISDLSSAQIDLASEEDDDASEKIIYEANDALLSWAVGVAFGRFDWRLIIGEREKLPEPTPFDKIPSYSPGMLPEGATAFHEHLGVLVDQRGHMHDIAYLVEEVLTRVNIRVPDNVHRWIQRDFFAFHLQCYSKSRRKAPIYWPLSTVSGSYTLWVYYPSLSNQTLFSTVNDFLDGPNGKLTQVSRDCADLRIKGGSRSHDEEMKYETLQAFEQELTDLRDTLLKIAPAYQPNHDDGVQVTAAPLWPLFRHKPWQKVLKDTWTKLEKGDYDWAHLAMAYWPDRVREKCKTDKSLAIAHNLEELYVEPEAAPKKTRGKKKAGADE